MRCLFLICCFYMIATSGCGLRERENALNKQAGEVAQKEQELILRENAVQVKEEALNKRAKFLDSTLQKTSDSLSLLHPQLPGSWLTKMTCIKTTCPGSAVGDTKNERWEMAFQNNTVVAKAMSNDKLVRIYTGNYAGNLLQLIAQQDTSTNSPGAKIIVRLRETNTNEMEGQREISREEGCQIVYALTLKKI